MKAGEVRRTIADGVATVEFFHPAKNSMPGALLERLASEISSAHADSAARVLLLKSGGEGPFCAGASFDELKGLADSAGAQQFFEGFAKVMLAMIRGSKPVVVRVQGKAVGGGVGLVAAADYAVASDTAQVRLSEIAIGIGPFTIGPAVERKIGPAAFGELAWTGDWRDAGWAHTRGLYQELHPGLRELDGAASTICAKFAGYSPQASAEFKRALWSGTDRWEQLLKERAAISAKLVLTPEAKAALKEK